MKGGQVTVFLIIGVILLSGIILVNVIRQDDADERMEVKVPQEMLPIKNYISQCIAEVGEDAIRKIGKNGGYIGTSQSDERYTKQTFKINDVLAPTDSDGIQFFPGMDWRIPYWQYFKSANTCRENCQCGSKQPNLLARDTSIQKQIERYLDENLKSCIDLDDLNGFDSIKGNAFKSKVYIGEDDVRVILDYRVEAKIESQLLTADNFDGRIPVRLKKVYELAASLAEAERNFTYLERQSMTIVSSFASINKDKLPPIIETELTPGGIGTRWLKSEVRNNVADLLSIYTPALSVADTANFEPRYDRYSLFILPNTHTDKDISVAFSYLSAWPMYFNIHGRGISGEIIGPESMGSSLFEFIGVKKYNYYYDYSYPVLVRIHDTKSFNGKGFDFYFAMESNVRSNKELRCEGPIKPAPLLDVPGPLICKRTQGCAEATVTVKDAFTGEAINDAILSYSCADTACALDTVDPFNQSSGKFTIPQCLNGRIIASKEGYMKDSGLNSYLCGEKYDVDLKLTPYIELNVSLKKKKLEHTVATGTGYKTTFTLTPKADSLNTLATGVLKTEEIDKETRTWSLTDVEASLFPNEDALIVLERIKENPQDEEYTTTAFLKGPTTASMKLLPGTYAVQILVSYKLPDGFGNDRFVIPAKHIHKEGDLLTDDIDYDLPEVVFNETMLAGQLMLNNYTGILEVSKNDLQGNRYARFYVPAIMKFDDLTHDDLHIFGDFEEISKGARPEFEPVFSQSRIE